MQLTTTQITDGQVTLAPSHVADTTFPTNIHLDLLRAGAIADPHLGFGERTVQWVHSAAWRYSAVLSVRPPPPPAHSRVCLVFEGLDTFATVRLDGVVVLESDNMFVSRRVDVTHLVSGRRPVALEIDFESALERGDEIMARSGGERAAWNGHLSRVFVRKAQYHYGWDWGPSLITCGPWKPIYVQIYTGRIASVKAIQTLSPDLKSATISLEATIETHSTGADGVYFVSASICSPSGREIRVSLAPRGLSVAGGDPGTYRSVSEICDPELWHPRLHGAQNLYTVTFTLSTSSVSSVSVSSVSAVSSLPLPVAATSPVLDTVTKRFGIRRVRLVQSTLPTYPTDPVSGGTSFYFEINNVPVFCGGSNWIPADSFLPRVTRAKLRALLGTLLAARGNQAMVRVWGGGVYESEDFYDVCDEAGVLVWQDMCLACADYPAHLDGFVASVSEEVTQNLARLRWHPSLVIVAGNNEDYQVADEELGYAHDQPQHEWRAGTFPARWLYEKVFPDIVRDVCNGGFGEGIGDSGEVGGGSAGVVYWPGSPWGGEDSTDRTVGDIHQWNVWGGVQAPYQRYPDLGGRFVSEFGMISYPCVQTIKQGFLDPALSFAESVQRGDWNPEAEIAEHHMKAHSFEKRCIAYLAENFRVNDGTMEERVYLSQLLQSEAMGFAYRGWRKRWGSRECGGVLVWQLNDVWPATSWAIIDFYLRPKPAFYIIARALAPITLILTRTTNNPKPNSKVESLVRSRTTKGAGNAAQHSTPHVYPAKASTVQVCVCSTSPADSGLLRAEIRFVCANTGRSQLAWQGEADVYGNGLVSLLDGKPVPEDEPTVVQALLWDAATGVLVARETDWPQPFKHYTFPDRGLEVAVEWVDDETKEDARIRVCAKKPVKGLVFGELDGVVLSDNCIDVIPGDEQVILANGLKGREVQWRYYGM